MTLKMGIKKKIEEEVTKRLNEKFEEYLKKDSWNDYTEYRIYSPYLIEEFEKIGTRGQKTIRQCKQVMKKAYVRTHFKKMKEEVENEFYDKVMKENK